MFTGIIENQAIVSSKNDLKKCTRFRFRFKGKERQIKLGESIAVNGVCLTVKAKSANAFDADVVGETLKATNLKYLQVNSVVNTERSLKAGDSIGGHFVSGHVDCCAKVTSIEQKGKDCYFTVNLPKAFLPFVAVKGSITIDGISLTIQRVSGSRVTVTLVPHTLQVTTLGKCRAGDIVNVEVDLMARYMVQAMKQARSAAPSRKLSVSFLKKQGF